MPEAYVRVPADGAGKKIHTRERVIGSDTVEEQYTIPIPYKVAAAIFFASTPTFTVAATADTPPAGRAFLLNPLGSGVLLAIRRIDFSSQHGSVLATPTSPRIQIRRFSYTGGTAGAGNDIVPAKRRTSDSAQVGVFKTVSTGLTGVADVAAVCTFLPVVALTATGANAPFDDAWTPDEYEDLVLAAGEGIYITQADVGTSSDTRRYCFNIDWWEFTEP